MKPRHGALESPFPQSLLPPLTMLFDGDAAIHLPASRRGGGLCSWRRGRLLRIQGIGFSARARRRKRQAPGRLPPRGLLPKRALRGPERPPSNTAGPPAEVKICPAISCRLVAPASDGYRDPPGSTPAGRCPAKGGRTSTIPIGYASGVDPAGLSPRLATV